MKRLWGIGAFVALLAVGGCASVFNGVDVTRSDMGADWPFTIERGYVTCQNTDIGDALFFTSDKGITYAINGTALTKKLAPDIRDSGIWALDDKHPELKLKKNIGPIMDKARSTCPP